MLFEGYSKVSSDLRFPRHRDAPRLVMVMVMVKFSALVRSHEASGDRPTGVTRSVVVILHWDQSYYKAYNVPRFTRSLQQPQSATGATQAPDARTCMSTTSSRAPVRAFRAFAHIGTVAAAATAGPEALGTHLVEELSTTSGSNRLRSE